jgi:hypothetical protein
MNFIYTTPQGFAHGVRYRDAMIRAWMRRTGRGNSYKPEDLPQGYDVPTNEERSRAEVLRFTVLEPMTHGSPSWTAYLSNDKRITTWTGETLANVTRITSYRAVSNPVLKIPSRGSFWAVGIDGRWYYGTHNGTGMYCRMRLAKYRFDYDIQQHTSEGWETVSSEATYKAACKAVTEYRDNQPELAVRLKRTKVRQ